MSLPPCKCGSTAIWGVEPGHMAVGESYGGSVALVDTSEPSTPMVSLCFVCWTRRHGGPLRAEAVI